MAGTDDTDDSAFEARFWRAATQAATVRRALKVAAIVGTVLIVINQGDRILAGTWPPVWKIALTYLVPYSVSTYSAASFQVALARTRAKARAARRVVDP